MENLPSLISSFASEAAMADVVEKDLDWAEYGDGSMEGATFAFLILAIINWIAQWGKYFIYFWFILDLNGLITKISGAASSLSGGATAETASAFGNLSAIASDLLDRFTVMTPIGLFMGTMLNSCVTFWPMTSYRGPDSLSPQFLGYFYSSSTAFFWTWWILGWIPTGAFLLDGILAKPMGSGTLSGWTLWLFIIEAALWLTTVLVLSFTKGALFAWFIKNHVKQAHETLQKFDKDITFDTPAKGKLTDAE